MRRGSFAWPVHTAVGVNDEDNQKSPYRTERLGFACTDRANG